MSASSGPPIHERHAAEVDRIEDIVLLLAAEDDATYETIQAQLDALDLSVFSVGEDVTVDEPVQYDDHQPASRQPFNALDFFAIVGYVEEFYIPVDETGPIELTDEGRRGVEALRAGLTPAEYEALQEVTA